MVPRMFRRLKLPLDSHMQYVAKLVDLHMRPSSLVDEGVTDSAIRRLLFDAGDDIEDLMTLVESDVTSKNPKRVQQVLDNYQVIRRKLQEVEEKDRIRNFAPPIDGEIPNEYEPARELLLKEAAERGLTPQEGESAQPTKD